MLPVNKGLPLRVEYSCSYFNPKRNSAACKIALSNSSLLLTSEKYFFQKKIEVEGKLSYKIVLIKEDEWDISESPIFSKWRPVKVMNYGLTLTGCHFGII